jgi:hypothetical protein
MNLKRGATIGLLFILPVLAARAETFAGHPRMPFWCLENREQSDPSVRYMGSGPEFRAWFQDQAVVLQRNKATVKIAFVRRSATQEIQIGGMGATGGQANYLFGSNPDRWQTGLPQFKAIRYTGIWPGIALVYKAEHGWLKAEYQVDANVGVGLTRLCPDAPAEIQPDGSLLIHSAGGDFAEEKPLLYQRITLLYQRINGEQRQVAGGFQKLLDGSVGFWTRDYDLAHPLVIDPPILISGYFGGASEDNITGVAIDSLNNIVVAGWTSFANLPASSGASQKRYGGNVDAFIASFLPNGGGLNYCTYIGGSGQDQALGIAVDSSRNVYITGWTSSPNFPLATPIQTKLLGTRDAFVTKLNAAGSALIYSTYLGGAGVDAGYALGLATGNAAVVVGDTRSANFPVTASAFQTVPGGSQDAFAAMISAAGNALSFATYLGGRGIDHASAIAVGPGGAFFVGGYTWSTNFPVANAQQPFSGRGQDGFVVKVNPTGSAMPWSTYLGGSGGSVGAPEQVNAIRLDSSNNVVVGGVAEQGRSHSGFTATVPSSSTSAATSRVCPPA